MAIDALSNITSALSQVYESELVTAYNKTARLASILPMKAGMGKNVAWSVIADGYASAKAVVEGADVVSGDYGADVPLPAVLSWAQYRAPFWISEMEVQSASTSVGSASALMDILGQRFLGSAAQLSSVINVDLYSGTGANGGGGSTANIVGLGGGALDATTTYAGISKAAHPLWASTKLANGGTPRSLTLALMDLMDANLFIASGQSPNVIVTSPGVFNKYKALFSSISTFANQPIMRFDPTTDNLSYKGINIIRDKDCPTGTMYFLNTDYIELTYLPQVFIGQEFAAPSSLVSTNGKMVTPFGSFVKTSALAKTGDSFKFMLQATLQLAVKRPNTCGVITDINES